jgi:hypothetical protein
MAADPLEQVLRLVAEGRLTADEADPILAALDDRPSAGPAFAPGPSASARPAERTTTLGASDQGSGARPPGEPGDERAGGASSLRIEVREDGRPVVNLRLPIAVGRFALDRVPGLSGDQVDRVREALRSGLRGPVLEVDDRDGDGVRIILE